MGERSTNTCQAHDKMVQLVTEHANDLKHGMEKFAEIDERLKSHERTLKAINDSQMKVEGFMNGKAQMKKAIIGWVSVTVVVGIAVLGAVYAVVATVSSNKFMGEIMKEYIQEERTKEIIRRNDRVREELYGGSRSEIKP